MGKHNNNNRSQPRHRKKAVTAVTFDQNQRHQYLKSMFGAKKRRRQFHQKRVEQEIKDERKQERAELREERRDKLRKTKEMVESFRGREKVEEVEAVKVKAEPEVKVKREGNVVIETKFY